jgi:hypothetical protein
MRTSKSFVGKVPVVNGEIRVTGDLVLARLQVGYGERIKFAFRGPRNPQIGGDRGFCLKRNAYAADMYIYKNG